MYTDLTYVNLALDRHYPRVVLLQRNLAQWAGERATAWQVIRNCGYQWWHPLRFDWQLAVEVADGHGNRSGKRAAAAGDRFVLAPKGEGQGRLVLSGTIAGEGVVVVNETLSEPVSIRLYRGDALLAVRPLPGPGTEAVFCFDRRLLIGTSLRCRQGEEVEVARFMEPLASIDLAGIRRGRLVMTGGGLGATARCLSFSLEREERW